MSSKNTFGNIVKGFAIGVVTGMVVLHLVCKKTSKKKLKHSAELMGENICSMFKMK